MIAAVNRVLLSTWLSYRALFVWLNPVGYLSSLVVFPASLGLLFVAVANATGADPLRPALGSALLATANAAMYGTVLAVAAERQFGTLGLWLASPQSLLGSLLARSSAHVLNGLLSGAATTAIVTAAFHIRLPLHAAAGILACWLAAGISACGLGIAAAGFSIRSRDALTTANVIRSLLLVASGAVVNVDSLAIDLRWLRPVLPVGHAVTAALSALRSRHALWGQLAAELAVGLLWGCAGYILLRRAVVVARKRGTLDLM